VKEERAEALLEEILRERCESLEKEKREDRTLFFCRDELVGSTAPINEETLAVTVYTKSLGDSIHKKLVEKGKELFNGDIKREGTKLSSGVEGNFYYTFLHVKL